MSSGRRCLLTALAQFGESSIAAFGTILDAERSCVTHGVLLEETGKRGTKLTLPESTEDSIFHRDRDRDRERGRALSSSV